MEQVLMRLADLRVMRRARHALAREHGFTIVETLMAGVILLILATGIAGVLTSSIAANTVARERTVAEQCANDQVEKIRRIPAYKDVGTVAGNPSGTVASSAACGNGLAATATVDIRYVDDPTPTSYGLDNYKRVTVTVTRDRDSKQLARVVTIVAPDGRPSCPSCGATINVTVVDLGLQQPYGGATVSLSNGPSSNRSDTSDVAGLVSFGALDPNPTTGPTSYYDLDVTAGAGYQTLAADVPPGSPTGPATASHIQVAPGQTYPMTTIRIFKPATINLVLIDGGGSPYTGGAALTINSSFTGATTTDSVAVGSSGKTITSIAGQPVIPGATYTFEGRTTSGLCAFPAPSPVPASGYPGNTTGTFTLQFTPCPAGDIAVNVKQLGVNIAGATVNITGGPNNMTITSPPLTDAGGNATFSVPAGTGYSVSATKGGQTAPSAAAAVTVGATTNVALVLPNPPTGTLDVNVTQLSAGVSGATVTLTGGPWSISATGTTNASGYVSFTGVPGGSGYTVTATKGSDTANTTTNVTAGSTTTVNLALPNPPTGSILATVTWIGLNVSGANVTLTGGPYSLNVSGMTAAPGTVTFTNVPSGSGYTVTATKNGQTRTVTGVSVSTGATTPVALAMPTATLTVTANWASLPAGNANVSVTGGPNAGTYTGTTNAITGIATITVPTTTSNNYTVTVTKNTGSGTSTVTTVPVGGQSTTVNLTPTKTVTITVQLSGGPYANQSVMISVTGGPNGSAGAAPAYTTSPTPRNTNGSSAVSVTVPRATGYTYTVKASRGPTCTAGANRTGTNTLSSATTPTTVTVNMNAALSCPYTP